MIDEKEEIKDTEDIEIQLFLEGMYLKYGYDFRDYSRRHIKRRIKNLIALNSFNSISEMQYQMLIDYNFFKSILPYFSINVTEMFRNPSLFNFIRKEILPLLSTYPMLKIWHAGCSTGEEVYSMAILLHEYGLYDRCQLYATDFNEDILNKAKEGQFSLEQIKKYTNNYIQSGGLEDFSDYYTIHYQTALINSELKKNIIFANHNLVTDQVFGEMHMIVCRNVLIYFNHTLQEKVIQLFKTSLCKGGILCLGSKETLLIDKEKEIEVYAQKQKIYRKSY